MSRGSCWAWPERAATQSKTGCSAPRFAWSLQASKTHNVTVLEGSQRKGRKNQVEMGQRGLAEKPESAWTPHELGLRQKKRPPHCGGLVMLAVDVVWTEPVSARLGRKICVFPCVYWAFQNAPAKRVLRKASYKKNARVPASHAYTRAGAKKESSPRVCKPPGAAHPLYVDPTQKLCGMFRVSGDPSGRLKKQDAAAMMHTRNRAVFGRFGAI